MHETPPHLYKLFVKHNDLYFIKSSHHIHSQLCDVVLRKLLGTPWNVKNHSVKEKMSITFLYLELIRYN